MLLDARTAAELTLSAPPVMQAQPGIARRCALAPTPWVPNGSKMPTFQKAGHIVATQAQFAPVARQADGGAAVEGQTLRAGGRRVGVARLVVGAGGCTGAVVVVDAGFEPEAGIQATAEVFGAAKAYTAAGHAGVGQRPVPAGAGVDVAHRGVHDAEQRDGGLGHGGAGCGQHGQGDEGFLHFKCLQSN